MHSFVVSIHAPRAGRDPMCLAIRTKRDRFNPRAPRGARRRADAPDDGKPQFQSTRPARGATAIAADTLAALDVSIHAPRAGRDRSTIRMSKTAKRFNPRAPRGARHGIVCAFAFLRLVSIHAPRAGRDLVSHTLGLVQQVSIHAPRAGRDSAVSYLEANRPVSIHAPRAGRD